MSESLQRHPQHGYLAERAWRAGYLHGVNCETLDPCVRYPGAEQRKTYPNSSKIRKTGKGGTDFRDAIHMDSMFRMDLIVASYISPADIRALRKLCRYWLKITYMRPFPSHL